MRSTKFQIDFSIARKYDLLMFSEAPSGYTRQPLFWECADSFPSDGATRAYHVTKYNLLTIELSGIFAISCTKLFNYCLWLCFRESECEVSVEKIGQEGYGKTAKEKPGDLSWMFLPLFLLTALCKVKKIQNKLG